MNDRQLGDHSRRQQRAIFVHILLLSPHLNDLRFDGWCAWVFLLVKPRVAVPQTVIDIPKHR